MTRDGRSDTARDLDVARDWIATDPDAIRDDVARLGVRGAALYQLDLMRGARTSGDTRWSCRLPAMIRALASLAREEETR